MAERQRASLYETSADRFHNRDSDNATQPEAAMAV